MPTQIIRIIKISVATLLLFPLLLGMGGTPKIYMNLDYRPVKGGSYNISAQEGRITYKDVKHFLPIVKMSRAMPHDAIMTFEIKEEREMQSDPVIGSFTLVFKKGETTPSEIRTPNRIPGVRNPPGAPDITKGSFWLGCTKAKRIKSNEGKGNDGRGKIFVEHSFGYVNGYQLTGTESPAYWVRCK